MSDSVEAQSEDFRLYVPRPEGWTAHVKTNSEKEYCYMKAPDDDRFHLLVLGEIFLEKNQEKYCLSCAWSHQLITKNRLHWQRREK